MPTHAAVEINLSIRKTRWKRLTHAHDPHDDKLRITDSLKQMTKQEFISRSGIAGKEAIYSRYMRAVDEDVWRQSHKESEMLESNLTAICWCLAVYGHEMCQVK